MDSIQTKAHVREINHPENVVMIGNQENCRMYCDKSNQIMIDSGEVPENTLVFEVIQT